jgi:hypothetical protein
VSQSTRRVPATPALRAVYDYFIKPLQRHISAGASSSIFTESIYTFFNAHFREVRFCKALVTFELPGKLVTAAPKVTRQVRRGDPLIVRRDVRTPDYNEVEFKDQQYILSAAQWRVVESRLELVC